MNETGLALATLLDDERGGTQHNLLASLLEARSGDGSPEVCQAAEALLRSSAPWALDVNGAMERVFESVADERSRRVFIDSSLARQGRPSIASVAEGVHLSRRRTREILERTEQRVRTAFATAPAPVTWTVSSLRGRLGPLTNARRADAALSRLSLSPGLCADLALWLAGPYREIPGQPNWLGREGVEAVTRTGACLTADGGVRRLVDVEQEVGEGMPAGQLAEWLAAWGAAIVGDTVISVAGSLVDVVERVLDAHGAPLTLEEIVNVIAEGGRDVPVTRLPAAQGNRRFRRVADGRLALADWDQHGTNPVPAAAPARRRRPPAERAKASDDNRLILWVRVDAETIRSGEASVPLALVEGLNMAPGSQRTFSSRFGPVTLTHDGHGATRRSLRAVALAAGAVVDSTLLLSFSARGDVEVAVRSHPGESGFDQPRSATADIFPDLALPGGT